MNKTLFVVLWVVFVAAAIPLVSADVVFTDSCFSDPFNATAADINATIVTDINWCVEWLNITSTGVWFKDVNFTTYGLGCTFDSTPDDYSQADMQILSSEFRQTYNNTCTGSSVSIPAGTTISTVRGVQSSFYFDRSTSISSIVINVSGIFLENASWTSGSGSPCFIGSMDHVNGNFYTLDGAGAAESALSLQNYSCGGSSGGGSSGSGGGGDPPPTSGDSGASPTVGSGVEDFGVSCAATIVSPQSTKIVQPLCTEGQSRGPFLIQVLNNDTSPRTFDVTLDGLECGVVPNSVVVHGKAVGDVVLDDCLCPDAGVSLNGSVLIQDTSSSACLARVPVQLIGSKISFLVLFVAVALLLAFLGLLVGFLVTLLRG